VNEPLLIVAALNGTRDRKVAKHVPYTADELAKEAKAAVEAGAGIVHVHARREDGTPVFDLTYDDVITAIRSAVDVPISISTQRLRQTSLGTVTALFSVLSELPDLATVNVAPLAPDLPAHREEARQILEALDAAGVAPEPVVPSLEGLADLTALYEDGLLAHAPWMHLALGGRPSEAEHGLAGTPQNLLRLVEALDGSAGKLRFVAHGLGAATPLVCATSAAVGGWVRVGLEDTALLPYGSVARSNAELVELAVALADAVGREPVEPAEARRLLRRGED
jgi:3-keto-5-aminohexanoate cleavage enzyme